jgi:hypothetical protein
VVHVSFFWQEEYGRITGGTRLLEPAAHSREERSLDVDQRS